LLKVDNRAYVDTPFFNQSDSHRAYVDTPFFNQSDSHNNILKFGKL